VDAVEEHILFSVEGQQYALKLAVVERVLRAVEITALPESFGVICGVINLQGGVIPVVDLRRRFGLPPRELDPSDQLLIVQSGSARVALPVDETLGIVREAVGDALQAGELGSQLSYVCAVIPLDGAMAMVIDMDRLLTPVEVESLAAIEQGSQSGEA